MSKSFVLSLLVVILLVGGALFVVPRLPGYLTTQVTPGGESSVTHEFSWTPDNLTMPGDHTLVVTVTDQHGASSHAQTTLRVSAGATATPSPAPPFTGASGGGNTSSPRGDAGGSSGGGGGGGGGGGNGSSGGGGTNTPTTALRKLSFAIGKTANVSGSYSGVITDGTQTVAKLAHNQAILNQPLTRVSGDCTLSVTVKGDKGPNPKQTVKFVTRLNKKAWKVLTLPAGHNDNKYRTYKLGILRNLKPNTTLSFQLLNDAYDKDIIKRTGSLPEDRDLNLVIQKSVVECG